MYSDRFNQYPSFQGNQYGFHEDFGPRKRFYQNNTEHNIYVPQLRENRHNQYQNYGHIRQNPYLTQNQPVSYNHYQKFYNHQPSFQSHLSEYSHQRPKIQFKAIGNSYDQRIYQKNIQRHVPIDVHQSMIRHYEQALYFIKSQNYTLIKKLKFQMQKMSQLYQMAQKMFSTSKSHSKQNQNFPNNQQNNKKNLTPAQILQNKIKSLNEKKVQDQKIKIQNIDKNKEKIKNNQENFNDFYAQQSFLVDENVEKIQKLKKINLKGQKANTFGLRKYSDEFQQHNQQQTVEQTTEKRDQFEDLRRQISIIQQFLDEFLCQKVTYAAKKDFNNQKIPKKDLLNIFLKWRLQKKRSINEKIDRALIQNQMTQQFIKRFVSCKFDDLNIIGVMFKDPEFLKTLL